ncbi:MULTISPECIES: hypothetical protein [Bosea]|uniref:hypothetical protein n=1 Tax=Bosea TaxID=85413 RepID=UPI00215057C2|nr:MULTISPECIES: hypothetical protein [Bosea]MCR4523693.1 hypothetical protein [Bosea sp. 47.2.35]MDR6830098.1 hypothetical protein [Bosea robiniae]MDR6896941.1 hypothetical protein [Bosea sp. BE109]MDR7140378.1 hypothetical protein [Bosea sp. BE168]MDR7177035.1 hypothetical protein [Bosea sp. BE271]
MQAEPAPSTETRHTLCVGDGAARLKLAETELTLSDEGIAYELDGRSGLRSFDKLTGVRLQAVNGGPRSPWEALAELTFTSGRPLFVHSSSPWGVDDPQRDTTFIAFIEDLHRRLVAGSHGHVAFRRGIPEKRHRFLIVVALIAAVVFGGAGLMVLYIGLSGKAGFFEVIGPLIGVGGLGFWILASVVKTAPGTYDPRHLPRDVFPE